VSATNTRSLDLFATKLHETSLLFIRHRLAKFAYLLNGPIQCANGSLVVGFWLGAFIVPIEVPTEASNSLDLPVLLRNVVHWRLDKVMILRIATFLEILPRGRVIVTPYRTIVARHLLSKEKPST
jgi:hypothetical protein